MFIGSSIIVMIGLVIYVVQTDLLFGLSGGVFRQDFLFDRLLPNPTYAIGVLFGIILTSIPVGWLIIEIVKQRYWGINRLQKWIIVLPLGTLLVVGLIASLKIGGGSNLHNLDLYIVGILMVLLLALEKGRGYFETLSNPRKSVFALLLIIPVAFNLHYSSKLNIPSDEIVQSYLDAIQAYVSEGELEGEVLFMDQRQLITFDLIHVDHFVFDYEKKKVMDRAMGKSQDYFDAFYEDLKNHRFSMIIGEPLVARNVDTTRAWSEENFVWQDWVVDSILEYYRPLIKFSDIGVQILVPK
jgi:hypothetical protein